ncbi:hypothetical protein [Acinetobacter gyllenbergii]|uniref:hypothetical protein n=1 Tax=Acinetobacter gyllenbergii TaxID=134534 RepID=UPI000806A465|nr:hypothetical protein [Acinetobacter gyllenbergii]OBY73639.1 hypothetical protein NG55_13345 [Acinetobacter gyllenbergii]
MKLDDVDKESAKLIIMYCLALILPFFVMLAYYRYDNAVKCNQTKVLGSVQEDVNTQLLNAVLEKIELRQRLFFDLLKAQEIQKRSACLQKSHEDAERCWREFQLDVQNEIKVFDHAVEQFAHVKPHHLIASDSIYDQGLLKSNVYQPNHMVEFAYQQIKRYLVDQIDQEDASLSQLDFELRWQLRQKLYQYADLRLGQVKSVESENNSQKICHVNVEFQKGKTAKLFYQPYEKLESAGRHGARKEYVALLYLEDHHGHHYKDIGEYILEAFKMK